jgi:hypothetical protein
MLNKAKKSIKISFLGKVGIFTSVFTLLFLGFANIGLAQYYQVNNGGYVSTYANNYSNVSITTAGTTNITSVGVTITGLINGAVLYNTYNITTWFQYGPTTNLEYSSASNNSNSGYADFQANLANLSPNTIYYYRAVGQTPLGIVYGSTNSFRTNFGSVRADTNETITNANTDVTTLTAITQPASLVGSTSAKLNSLILSPNSDAETTWFEYGTTALLGSTTNPVSTGGLQSVKHIGTLSRLVPNTTYYFRAVVLDASTRINGSILSFKTGSASATNTTATTSGISSTDTVTPATPAETNSYSNSLGANVFSSGSFLPISLLGWLLIIILILILIILIRHPRLKFWKNTPQTENISAKH